jgi:hypothetical protein
LIFIFSSVPAARQSAPVTCHVCWQAHLVRNLPIGSIFPGFTIREFQLPIFEASFLIRAVCTKSVRVFPLVIRLNVERNFDHLTLLVDGLDRPRPIHLVFQVLAQRPLT